VFGFWFVGSSSAFFSAAKCLKTGSEALQFKEDFDIIPRQESVKVSRAVLNWNIGLKLHRVPF
jgi:hypothetical protein